MSAVADTLARTLAHPTAPMVAHSGIIPGAREETADE